MQYGISREEESKIPEFKSHDEARKYFKDKYGDDFQLVDSENTSDGKIYFYKLILNREVYMDMIKEMNKSGYVPMTEERMFCTQDIQIFEDGHIHIVH